MIRDRFTQAESEAIRLQDSCWLDTIHFFRNAIVICRLFDKWKDNDSFYFIPLKLDMAYHIGGHTICMADGPIFLGTFIRNTLEHKELFSFKCPRCGEEVIPFSYNGSPLSGRIDLVGQCECGWSGGMTVSGWKIRSEALKESQRQDEERLSSFLKKGVPPANIRSLLREFNVDVE